MLSGIYKKNTNAQAVIRIARKSLMKILKKRFGNTCKFSNDDIHKLLLLFRKGVEYMDDWEKFNETLLPYLPEKEDFTVT